MDCGWWGWTYGHLQKAVCKVNDFLDLRFLTFLPFITTMFSLLFALFLLVAIFLTTSFLLGCFHGLLLDLLLSGRVRLQLLFYLFSFTYACVHGSLLCCNFDPFVCGLGGWFLRFRCGRSISILLLSESIYYYHLCSFYIHTFFDSFRIPRFVCAGVIAWIKCRVMMKCMYILYFLNSTPLEQAIQQTQWPVYLEISRVISV